MTEMPGPAAPDVPDRANGVPGVPGVPGSLWARLEWVLLAVALLPIAAAVARRSGTRWIPIGDNALVEMRARDVFSVDHFPLLGTWSSASIGAGKDLNHPGPLLFDILAVPVKLFGGATGVALGVGLVNAAAVTGTMLVARRIAGRAGAVVATAVAAVLAHMLGSAMLTDPWNPHALVLPALFVLVSTWAVAAGDLRVLPWLLVGASLCWQVHLGYSYLIPAMVLTALAGAGFVHRRRWRIDPAQRSGDLRSIRRIGLVSVATVLVLWAQPLLEQFFGAGQGNLARIATSTGSDESTIGVALAVRITGSVVPPPFWAARSSWTEAIPHTPYAADGVTISPVGMTGLAVASALLLGLLAALAAVGWFGWRRTDRVTSVGAAVAVVATVVATTSLVITPVGPLGLTPHQMRWLWSIGAFASLVLVLGLVRLLGSREPTEGGTVPAPRLVSPVTIGAVVVVIASLANVPGFVQAAGPDEFPEAIPAARAISDQVREYRTDDAVVLDAEGLRYLEPYSAVVLAALQQAGVDFRVREEGLVRQVGEARRAEGDEPLTVYLREAREALEVPEGSERIAFTSRLDQAEIDELLAGEQAMIDEITAFPIVFSVEGERLVAAGAFGTDAQGIIEASLDAAEFVRSGFVAELVAAGALELDPSVRELFERMSALRRQVGTDTVAVLIRPS